MRIAVAAEGNSVSGHFGHCQGFYLYDTEGEKISNKSFIENPGHKPGFLPVFLGEKGVNIIIAGGMGKKAQELFSARDIDIVTGAQGECDNVIKSYLKGELESTGSICNEHKHEGHCNE